MVTEKEYRITSRLARLQAAAALVGQALAHMLDGPDRTAMKTALTIINRQVTHDEANIALVKN
jgi:hypothetical protein